MAVHAPEPGVGRLCAVEEDARGASDEKEKIKKIAPSRGQGRTERRKQATGNKN